MFARVWTRRLRCWIITIAKNVSLRTIFEKANEWKQIHYYQRCGIFHFPFFCLNKFISSDSVVFRIIVTLCCRWSVELMAQPSHEITRNNNDETNVSIGWICALILHWNKRWNRVAHTFFVFPFIHRFSREQCSDYEVVTLLLQPDAIQVKLKLTYVHFLQQKQKLNQNKNTRFGWKKLLLIPILFSFSFNLRCDNYSSEGDNDTIALSVYFHQATMVKYRTDVVLDWLDLIGW